ncbi:MAG: shikimate dehydrogenase family protein [Bacteroidota bacterium]
MNRSDRIFGLIGYPLSHSFSKKYFTEKFNKENIPHTSYELFEIQSIADLKIILEHNPTLCGLNVTIPHKETVIPYLNNVSDAVLKIGACNCIKIENGNLIGYNTDVVGFEKMLIPYLKPHHTKALILGTGGAAKAVAWVMNKFNIEFLYVSRQEGEKKIAYSAIDKNVMNAHTLIINTTPLGMSPNTDKAPEIPYNFITAKHLCVDLIYNPPKTKFLELSEHEGATILNGQEMLVIQAEESWKIWNGSR